MPRLREDKRIHADPQWHWKTAPFQLTFFLIENKTEAKDIRLDRMFWIENESEIKCVYLSKYGRV